MGRRKVVNGICRLCGLETKLTFEHVPPRSSYNKTTRYKSISMEYYFRNPDPLNMKVKNKELQGGTGFHSLCSTCNNFLGRTYVDYYKNWVDVGIQVLEQEGNHPIYVYDVINIKPLNIIKQIISMFISLNDVWFLESYPELSEFVRNPESEELPDKYQVYTYLNNEGQIRNLPFQVKGNLKTSQIIKCSELSFPPYGYVLTFDKDVKINHLCDITYFKNYSLDDITDIELKMYRLPTHLQVPLDSHTSAHLQCVLLYYLVVQQ